MCREKEGRQEKLVDQDFLAGMEKLVLLVHQYVLTGTNRSNMFIYMFRKDL